jgi:hypothetical protein
MTRQQKIKLLKAISTGRGTIADLGIMQAFHIAMPSRKGPQWVDIDGKNYYRDNLPKNGTIIFPQQDTPESLVAWFDWYDNGDISKLPNN